MFEKLLYHSCIAQIQYRRKVKQTLEKHDPRSVRRIALYSITKPTENEKGEREIDTISVSLALQIAERAGRYRPMEDLHDNYCQKFYDIFVNLCTVDDSLCFMCNIEDFQFLAEMIQHVPLPLRARYVFSCAPIKRKMAFLCSMFLKCLLHDPGLPYMPGWLCQAAWKVAICILFRNCTITERDPRGTLYAGLQPVCDQYVIKYYTEYV
uniref:Suv3_C_1 domain-containing protein n=1 Tax=Glossina pallidipes TaxID=7398 RepID=A0A1B0A635_GLOPL